jgi:hypothetical protein
MAEVNVLVTGAGSVLGGEVNSSDDVNAKCSLCDSAVDVAASIGDERFACAPCLRDRLDAMSVARFRLTAGRTAGIPWGKVTG